MHQDRRQKEKDRKDDKEEEEEGEGEDGKKKPFSEHLLNDIESKCPNYQRLLHVYVEKGEDAIVKVTPFPLV